MLLTLLTTFFRIGLFTIGGGYAMIPLIEKEVVQNRKWISEKDFMDLLAIAQAAPGVFAVNISIFIGYRLRRVRGSVACAFGTVLPSVLIILLIALFFQQFKEYELVENVFKGIRPAVVALILTPAIKLGKAAQLNRYTLWVPIVSAVLICCLGVSPIAIIAVAIVAAIAYSVYSGRRKS